MMPNPWFRVPGVGPSYYEGCRDSWASVARGGYGGKPRIDSMPGPDDWEIEYQDSYLNFDYTEVMDYLRVLWRAAAGETNSKFSPFHSPFTARWIIDKGRKFCNLDDSEQKRRLASLPGLDDVKACRKFANKYCRDKVYRAMKKADKVGLELLSDWKKAWGIEPRINSSFGITGMYNAKRALLPRLDYKEVFPPFEVLSLL